MIFATIFAEKEFSVHLFFNLFGKWVMLCLFIVHTDIRYDFHSRLCLCLTIPQFLPFWSSGVHPWF